MALLLALLSYLGAAIAIYLIGQRILYGQESMLMTAGILLAIVGTLFTIMRSYSSLYERARRVRWVLCGLPLIAMLASAPAWNSVRDWRIARDEARAAGVVAAYREARRVNSVRARFEVSGKPYLTSWIAIRKRSYLREGDAVTVRYAADDPRIAEILAPSD